MEALMTVLNARASFTVQLTIQESMLNQQYAGQPEKVAEEINKLLTDHSIALCQNLHGYNYARAVTPNGFVMAVVNGGWSIELPATADALILNSTAGDGARITIYDTQMGISLEEEMAIAQQYYPGKVYEDKTVGRNSYKYNMSDDGRMFDLIAVTSTGSSVRIHAENCTMEQAASLLEYIVIR